MTRRERYEAFMEKVLQRPLPKNPMARIRTIAKELAEGLSEGAWDPLSLIVALGDEVDEETGKRETRFKPHEVYADYFSRRWNNDYPSLFLLKQNGFFDSHYQLTKAAYALVEEVEPVEIFISYRRKESSAFALLVLARLKDFDLHAFLDMSIRPGDNWHAYIKDQIQQRDYFILLLGKESLASDYVKQEILWALEAKAEIFPIWHNGYEYVQGAIDLPSEIDKVLGRTHTIRVLEESALAYNNAIVELLNRFGITP